MEETLSDHREFARLFKFDNITTYETIRLEMLRANRSEVIQVLADMLNWSQIDDQLNIVRLEKFTEFDWVKALVGNIDGIVANVKDVIYHSQYLARTLDTSLENDDLLRSFLQILKQGSIGQVVDSSFNVLKGIELLFGNSPASQYLALVEASFNDLEIIQALREIEFKIAIRDLFHTWDPIGAFMADSLNMTSNVITSISEARLDLPKIILGTGGPANQTIIDYVCDPQLLDDYLVPPDHFDAIDMDTQDISEALCNMTSGLALNLTIVMVEEVNIEMFLREVSPMSPSLVH
eukprot:maker-scaffold927_size80360-snap-gene-0.23 protein:Tk12213 transcript:maker-scaffold927_size80360-snap-gene-0.23-mRNA-1 annotation:"hypothetical protein"